MSEPAIEDRLAALQARRGGASPRRAPAAGGDAAPEPEQFAEVISFAPEQPVDATTVLQSVPDDQPPMVWDSEPSWDDGPAGMRRFLPLGWSPDLSAGRVAAAGTSVVSFAAMVVAMGPILAEATENVEASAEPGGVAPADAEALPSAPQVSIEVNPVAAAPADPNAAPGIPTLPPAPPSDAAAAPADAATPAPPADEGQPSVPPSTAAGGGTVAPTTAAPTTAAPATPAPTTAAPGATAPPTTAAPATAAPTTAAPTTAAPTTAAPTTAPPTTPPKSEGSG